MGIGCIAESQAICTQGYSRWVRIWPMSYQVSHRAFPSCPPPWLALLSPELSQSIRGYVRGYIFICSLCMTFPAYSFLRLVLCSFSPPFHCPEMFWKVLIQWWFHPIFFMVSYLFVIHYYTPKLSLRDWRSLFVIFIQKPWVSQHNNKNFILFTIDQWPNFVLHIKTKHFCIV